MTGRRSCQLVPCLLGSVATPSASGGELFLGGLGPGALTGDLDEVGAVGQAIEGGGSQQGLAEEFGPFGSIAIRSQENRAALAAFVDDVVEILGPWGGGDA